MKLLRPITADHVQEKFATARRELSTSLIEREEEIDLVLTALIAHEHVLLVGPPGTGKSLLLDAVMRWMNSRKFSILLTKFTCVEEVMGPISLSALKEDRYRRVTTNRLPEAQVCFIDEIWKASSAILNTLLKVLNERVFENDGEALAVPLRLAVAKSNEWPAPETGKELSALLDRFLIRKTVRPIITSAGRQRLLWHTDHTPRLSAGITLDEVDHAHTAAMTLPWSTEAKEALEAILRELHREGVVPGDRRQFKSVAAARAFAYLEGASAVEPDHLGVLAHVLWDAPEEQPQRAAQVIAKIANPAGMRVSALLLETEQVLAAADVRNLAQAATAAAKLAEIDRQFASMRGNGRLDRARAYVKDALKKLKLASIEAI